MVIEVFRVMLRESFFVYIISQYIYIYAHRQGSIGSSVGQGSRYDAR